MKRILPITLAALALPALCYGANLTWDANTAIAGAQDGSGTWDISTASWWTGSADALFSNATPDVPTFGAGNGVAGTVTLGANIVSGNITFSASAVGSYTIAGGGNTLGLTNRTITANVNAAISANIAGNGLTLANSAATAPSAVLTLSGNNSFTNFNLGANAGNTTAAARIGSSTALGAGTVAGIAGGQGNQTSQRFELAGNNLTVTNAIPGSLGRNNNAAVIVNLGTGNTWSGTLTKSTGGQDTHLASEVANGLTFSGASGGGVALVSSASSPRFFVLRGSGGGAVSGIISAGTGNVGVGIVKAGSGTWTLSGANTYTNPTIVDEGTLTLDYGVQNNSKLADIGPLVLGGGRLNLSGGSHTEVVVSTSVNPGNSSVTRSSGASTLRMNAINRTRGGVVDFGAAAIADTDTLNVNGILGGYATIAGADWAINSTGAGDGPITAYTGYTDIAASGSAIADGAATNLRLNSAGGGGSITLGAATTTINTLLQNTSTSATIDSSAQVLRLGATGGVLVPASSQSLTIGTAANSGTLTAGGADNTPGEVVLINNSPNALTVNSVIANNGSGPVWLTKAGSGSATLAGSNTYTGSNNIVGGTLNISDDSNLGTAPAAATAGSILINGGALNATASFTLNANRGIALGPISRYGNGSIGVNSGQTLTYNGIVANADLTGNGPAGGLIKIGNGVLVLGGANTYSNGTIINAGTLSVTTSGNLGGLPGCYIPDHLVINGGTLEATASFTLGAPRGIMLGPVGAAGAGTFQVDSGLSLQLDSRIADNWNGTGSLTKTGDGTLVITSGVNDYSGNTTVSAGALQVNNSRSLPNGAGKGNVTVNGTLNINAVNVALNGLSGSGTVDNTGAAAVTLSVGNNDQTSAFGGTIQNSSGALALSKAGIGTLTLTGSANHSGSTIVTAGTLALAGSATIGSTTNLAVNAGAVLDVSGLSGGLTLNSGQTLSGSGVVLGSINTGTGTLAPGSSAGTLTVAGLTLGSGSSLRYDLANVTTSGGGVNDLTVVTGALVVAGPVALSLNYLNGLPAASGKYILCTYGSFAGNVTDISVPSGFTINNNTSTKAIELLINHIPANLVWRGDGSSDVWDIDTTPNWIQSGSPVTFFNGDTANFDDTGSNSPPIFVATPVIAASVNINASRTYDFTGSSVSGATFSKSGSGTWIMENDNSFTFGGIISGGTVQVGNGGATGSLTGGGSLTNNGALVLAQTADLIFTNSISGSGGIAQILGGTIALSGSNSYAGLTTISSGRLYPRNPFALGDTNTGTLVSSGAQIFIDQNINIAAEPLVLNGPGLNPATDGALRKGGAGVSTFAGPITLGSDSIISVDGNATLNLSHPNGITSSTANLVLQGDTGSSGTVSGPVNLAGGGGILAKTGTGSWTLGGSNSMSLSTISNGTLVLANTYALGTNQNVVLTSTTGGAGLTGTRLTLSGGISIPADRTLTMPSSGAGAVRSAFVGTGAGVTNTWAGTVLLTGDSAGSGNVLGFGADANSTFVIGGNVTSDATFLGGKLLVRGNATGVGYLLGTVALDPANGQLQVDDGSTWIFASGANTWLTTIFAGSSTIRLAANNGLPTATLFTVGNGTGNRFDLAGFNQQVAGMDIGSGNLTITNSSVTSDSTFTYSSAGTYSFGGTLIDGVRKLNLTIAAGNLTLTNATSLNLTKSTVSISGGGAVLEMDFVGTNKVAGLVLNGSSQPPGVYNILNASPYLAGVGNLQVAVPIPSAPTNLTWSVTSGQLNLGWAGYQGWLAQSNSTSLLDTNAWHDIAGSDTVTNLSITIDPANRQLFYRLRHP